jgi:damage-control phosphatase, subfamily I
MISESRCVPCVIQQCQRIARIVTDDEGKLQIITHRALDRIQELTLDEPPSLFTSRVLLDTYAALGVEDPFAEIRKQMNELGRKTAEMARARIERSDDPLHTAILYAAAGNIIDVGPRASFDLDGALEHLHFRHDDYRVLREKLRTARTILYVLDNAGEIFLDRLVLERLTEYRLTMVVKPGPILNDAIVSDAEAADLPALGRVITTGSRVLGVDPDQLDHATRSGQLSEFADVFESADVVIAKGHANFESMVDLERDAFFVLKAKCPVVANRLRVAEGDSVLYCS